MNISPQTPEPAPDASRRKLFYGLFIFPLLIAVGMALLLCTVVFLTHEKTTPDALVDSIKSGMKGKRWQKSFELSNELNQHPEAATPALMQEMLYIFDPANGYDSKTRSYIALALGRFQDPAAVRALEQALSDDDPDTRVYALWSLGRLQSRASVSKIIPLLSDEDASIRKTAAYVLGAVGDSSAIATLHEKLADPAPDVRWNCALALARLRDASGAPILRSMLDRQALEKDLNLSEGQIEPAMINATKGLILIRDAESVTILQLIARQDPNLKVRQAAIEALELLKNK